MSSDLIINNKTALQYAMLLLLLVIALASVFTLNLILIILCTTSTLIAFFCYKLWDVIEAQVFRYTNLVQVIGAYELRHDRASAIRQTQSGFSAVTAAVLEVNKEVQIDRKKIENLISHLAFPFKFTMQAERLLLDPILDKLQTRKSMREIELSRMDTKNKRNLLKANRLKSEIETLELDIRSISGGETPVKAAFYIMTSAMSENEFEAEEKAKSQLRELSSQFDAMLGGRSKRLEGNELLWLLQLDSAMVFE